MVQAFRIMSSQPSQRLTGSADYRIADLKVEIQTNIVYIILSQIAPVWGYTAVRYIMIRVPPCSSAQQIENMESQLLMKLISLRIYLGCCFLIVVLGACGDQTVEVSPSVAWGAASSVVQSGNLYFAGQPDRQTLETARSAGIQTVLNLRMPDEMDWDEAAVAAELGLEYLDMPISRSGPGFDSEIIERLHRYISDHPNEKILMHCSSGNRVSAWYALYLVQKKGYSLDEALPIAEQTGLTHADLVTRLQEYLDQT